MGDVGVLAGMIAWVFRAVRGALLVALVLAVVWSASYLLASTRAAPSAADRSAPAAAQVANAALAAGAGASAEMTSAADQTAAAQALGASLDSAEATQPAADTASAPDVSDAAKAAASTGQYRRIEIAKLGYGSGDAEIGLSTGSERRAVGPMSFAVDGSGVVYVSDNVNGRVQAYSAQGSHLRSLKVDTYVYDVTSDQSSDLYLLGTNGSIVVQDATTGEVKAKGAAASSIAKGLGRLRAVGGRVSLVSPEQVAYPLAARQPTGLSLLSSEAQLSGKSKGWPTPSQAHYSTSYRDGGHVYQVDDGGKTTQDIALNLPDVQSVVFLNEDRSGSIYVQVERASGNGQVGVEVRQLSKKGTVTAVIPIDRVDYLPMARSTIVVDDGTIYQAVPSAQGVALVRYERS